MYSKEEISKIKEEFWTTFGRYLAPVPSAEESKINWVNYKTGIKNIRFFMEAGAKSASIGIQLSHNDPDIQQLFFEEFLTLRPQLHEYLQEVWLWEMHTKDSNGRVISCIYKEIQEVNLFRREDWPDIISFLKPRLIALDAFWSDWKYNFEALL